MPHTIIANLVETLLKFYLAHVQMLCYSLSVPKPSAISWHIMGRHFIMHNVKSCVSIFPIKLLYCPIQSLRNEY